MGSESQATFHSGGTKPVSWRSWPREERPFIQLTLPEGDPLSSFSDQRASFSKILCVLLQISLTQDSRAIAEL